MGHSNALHVETSYTCLCCGIGYRRTFHNRYEHLLCGTCTGHQRRDQEAVARRNTEHLELWSSLTGRIRARNEEQRAALGAKVAELEEALAERGETIATLRENLNVLTLEMERLLEGSAEGTVREPSEYVVRLLANTVAEQAIEEREVAYRSRDWVYGRIWVVDDIHHDDDENPRTCTCGTPTRDCATFNAIEPVRNSLYKWEQRQVERIEKNLPHGLPREHPKVKEHRPAWRQIG